MSPGVLTVKLQFTDMKHICNLDNASCMLYLNYSFVLFIVKNSLFNYIFRIVLKRYLIDQNDPITFYKN